MTDRGYLHRVDDMLEAVDGIRHAVSGKSLDDYRSDWVLRHAVQRGIEIISEASRALPAAFQACAPDIPWSSIRGIGNVLRHEYYSLSDPIIWNVVVDELPRLRDVLAGLRDRGEQGDR